jgi:hypothetical protein
MLDTLPRRQDGSTPYPTTGVRVGITHHQQTTGKHRARFYFDKPVADVLRRGLFSPRLHIDGDMVNGLRIWCDERCDEKIGMTPTIAHAGSWSFTVPIRRVRGAERTVNMAPVDFQWQLDEPGPVLLIPRLPDALLPVAVIDKLPNSAVDPETRRDRADKRLQREMAALYAEAPEAPEVPDEPPQPDPPPPDGEPVPNADADELRAAIALVNDLVDLIGDGVTLAIDESGHITARRRVVMFVDL